MSQVKPNAESLKVYPGGDLVAKGLSDLEQGLRTEEALLVMVAGPRLRGLGFVFQGLDSVPRPYEHALYATLQERLPIGAHGAYNALIQRIVSFANSYRSP